MTVEAALPPVHVRTNVALREPPGLSRLVVGGDGNGQIQHTYECVLTLRFYGSDANPGPQRYEPAEIHLWSDVYRTWRLASHDPAEHALAAVRTLIDTDPARVARIRLTL